MEKKQLMDVLKSKAANVAEILSVKRKTYVRSNGLMDGLVVKTNIKLTEFITVRLECATGMSHNSLKNNVFSVNFFLYQSMFKTCAVSKENWSGDVISQVIAYIDDDGTVSLYLKAAGDNIPAYTGFELYVYTCGVSNIDSGNKITSAEFTKEKYVPHDIEITAQIAEEG